MFSWDAATLIMLTGVALVAGCVDAIAGGGGLLTVPVLTFAGLDPRAAIATNKLQGSFGTASAAFTFIWAGELDLRAAWPYGLAAAAGSTIGALALAHVPQQAVTTALPFLLIGVALYFALSPRLGDADRQQRLSAPAFIGSFAPLVGFYDGVFGPGAGSFYMVGFIGLLGFGTVRATAHTKLANFASNLAGLVTLALSGNIVWIVGLAMGCGQILGGRIGARLALRHGTRLVKPLLISISLILAIKLAMNPAHPIRIWVTSLWG